MSLTSNTSCKMMKSSLAENIDELRDDTFVSKMNLESSIQEVLRKPLRSSKEAPKKPPGSQGRKSVYEEKYLLEKIWL